MLGGCFDGGSSPGSKKRQVVHQVNDSLFELHKPEVTPSMQIVLFHGLNLGESSDAHLSTWEAEDGSIWPQKWLVEEYPAAHIFSVSYSGTVVKTSNEKFDVNIIVESLISDLWDANIGQTPYCPVVLVGHSFGGLVIKQLCLESRKLIFSESEDERTKAQSFLDNVRGIFYYGTSHHGSPLVSPQAAERKSPLLRYFRTLNTEAEQLKLEFDELCRSYPKWQVGGLGESLPAKSGLFQDVVAVSEASSRQGDFYIVVAADQISISKPCSKEDRRFYSFTGLLKTIAKNLEEEGRKHEEAMLQEARPQKYQSLPQAMVNVDTEVDQISSKLGTMILGFGHLATLNHLEFHHCHDLHTLPDSFGHLATLNHLEFHHCWRLQTLPDSFGHLATLNHLEFHYCKSLHTLPDSFGHLATLNHLDFHDCWRLQTLPDSFGHLATLNHLEFHDCWCLQTLPDSFGHLATLNHLDFHDCWCLQTLPDSFGHLATLNHLEFHTCDKLETLPDSFGHLATLNHLEFHHCWCLQTLPDSFGHLATLNHLEFHHCKNLHTLPDSFGHLATLNHLEFHHCKSLHTLPDSFGHLATLNHLEFRNCHELQTLPDSFGQLVTLDHLEFHDCHCLQILPNSFRHLATTLNHLEFHNCDKLQTLPDSFGHLATVNDVLKWDCGDIECEGDWKQKFRRFIIEVVKESANGYFVSKIWLSSLHKHHWEAVVSALGGAGYFEIYQTRTTMFYERMEDYTQASSICNDSASTPENKNACDGYTRLAAASDDSGDQLDFDGKTLPFNKEKEYPDEVLEDSSSEKDSDKKDKDANESTMARINEVSLVDSPRNLFQGGETPLASSNEELRSFKRTLRDSSMYNDDLSLSTNRLSILNHQDLNAALSKAGYSKTSNTKTSSYFERIQSRFPNSQTNQGAIFNRSEKSNVVGEAGSPIVFQGGGDSLIDAVQGMDIVDKISGVKNATEAIPKIEAKCECPLQLLTVSCTKPMRSQAELSTSSSQVECNVTVPEGELLEISTVVDKDISMETFNFTETPGHSKVVPLNVSAEVSLSCCVTSDHKNVRIHILGILGEAKVGEPFNKRTNALVFKSVRTNVDAWIKKSPAGPEYIRLNIKEDNCPPPWRRVLHTCRPRGTNGQRKGPEDLMWLDLAGKRPKNSRPGTKTLELQHHVKNRLKIDLDEDSHRALVLYFDGDLPVTFEGDIRVDLDPNSCFELHVRHEVEISYNVPCDPHPTTDAISVFTTRINKVVEFDCVLEFRTQKFSSQNPVS